MERSKIIAFLFLILLIISSCGKDDNVDEKNNGNLTEFNLQNLTVGQSFKFVLLRGEEYWTNGENNLFDYPGDTLLIEVMSHEFDGTVVKESILPTSAMFSDPSPYYWYGKDSIYQNVWSVLNDTLRIQTYNGDDRFINSHLFSGWDIYLDPNGPLKVNISLPLNDFTNEKVEIDGWKTDKDYCECDRELFIEDLNLLGNDYDRLNVAIRNTPMQTDGNGTTTIYSEDLGIVRTSSYSWWTGTGFCWDRVF